MLICLMAGFVSRSSHSLIAFCNLSRAAPLLQFVRGTTTLVVFLVLFFDALVDVALAEGWLIVDPVVDPAVNAGLLLSAEGWFMLLVEAEDDAGDDARAEAAWR